MSLARRDFLLTVAGAAGGAEGCAVAAAEGPPAAGWAVGVAVVESAGFCPHAIVTTAQMANATWRFMVFSFDSDLGAC